MTFDFKKFEVSSLRDTDSWPCGTFLWDISRCYLSPWILLQCCLESVLQVLFFFKKKTSLAVAWTVTISALLIYFKNAAWWYLGAYGGKR